MSNLKRLFALFGKYRKSIMIACILLIIETSFELIIPTMMADLIDNGVATGDVRYMQPMRAQQQCARNSPFNAGR